MSETTETCPIKMDCGYILILMLMLGVVCWLLTMPLVPNVQQISLNRFHLQTQSFAGWAVQQPIPSMYNFYNRYEIGPAPKGFARKHWDRGTVNHFPVRMFTFGDNRAIFLRTPEIRWLDVWSSYRGEQLHTTWFALPADDGGFDLSSEVVP